MEPTILIVAWVFGAGIFAGLGAYISNEKNRDPGEGIILGLMFGPLGCLIAAILPSKAATTATAPKNKPTYSRAENDAYAEQIRAFYAKQRADAAAAKAKAIADLEARRQASIEWYRSRGVEPSPLAWFRLLPNWLQPILLGGAFSLPLVGALIWFLGR